MHMYTMLHSFDRIDEYCKLLSPALLSAVSDLTAFVVLFEERFARGFAVVFKLPPESMRLATRGIMHCMSISRRE